MNRIWKWFLHGIALIAPVALTVTLLVWLAAWSERTFGTAIRAILPDGWYFQGLGLISGFVVTLIVGLAANLFLVRWAVRLIEALLARIPLVTSLFQAFKDIARLIARDTDDALGQVVAVDIGGTQLVGFVTQHEALLPGVKEDTAPLVAVYLAMSYQLGGYTLFVNRDQLEEVGMSMKDASRYILTAGVSK